MPSAEDTFASLIHATILAVAHQQPATGCTTKSRQELRDQCHKRCNLMHSSDYQLGVACQNIDVCHLLGNHAACNDAISDKLPGVLDI